MIVVGYLAGVLVFGLWVGRGQRSAADYFLGGRSLPWWAVLLSIVATETSTVTFLSIPGITFAAAGDLRFLQITFGYIAGRFVVLTLLLPLYFRGEPYTSYEVLEGRFGVAARRITSVLFLVTRNLSDALRLYLTALALEQVVGLSFAACVIVIGCVTIVYTFFGGAKSVIWNDCIQFLVYTIGAVITLVVVVSLLPGGLEQLREFGLQGNKFRLFDFDLGLTGSTMTFWSGLVGGMFLTAATHGTDQLMVQRYLSARNQRDASWALGLSGFVVLMQFALFLIIGMALACFYQQFPSATLLDDGDRVFAHFIVHHLGRGLTGITLAAVFAAAMSTLSSSLNSSATALINDLYLPLTKRQLDARQQLWLGRVATIGFGIVQIAIALAAHQIGTDESTVTNVLKIAAFATGPVLGLYFLAVLAQRVQQRAALIGLVFSNGHRDFVGGRQSHKRLLALVRVDWFAFDVCDWLSGKLCDVGRSKERIGLIHLTLLKLKRETAKFAKSAK